MRAFLLTSILLTSFGTHAQGVATPKNVWLSNLRPVMTGGLCSAQSPLMKIYKGEAGDCPKQLDVLFTRCTTQVPEVSIPEMLTSEAQANLYGVIIAECIGAQYQGGDALKAFLAFQVRFNESVAGKSGG